MNRCLIITCLVFFFCSSIFADDWSVYEGAEYYPLPDKKDCVFPFDFNGKSYGDCTVANYENGEYPWCSLTKAYEGLITYCYDFRNTTLQCVYPFKMPDGKVYNKCDYLSKTARYKQCRTNHTVIKYRYCTDALASSYKKSVQRRKDCDQNYAKLAADHTMCFGPSPYAFEVPLNDSEKVDVLVMHNQYRAAVPSRYMFKLYWDDELAKLAQAHANLCVFEHDLAVNRLSPKYNWKNGQNLVQSSEINSNPATLIDIMLSTEKENFRYGKPCAGNPSSCLHYTQAMLSNLTRVGCGQTHCIFPDHIERYLTCNYIHSQYQDNYRTPYVESVQPAIDCTSKNVSGLCDCKDKICQYDIGEYLEPDTCLCRTRKSKRSVEEPDANELELDAAENKVAKLRPAGSVPKSFDKREIKTIRFGHIQKRSANEVDPNEEALDAAETKVAKLRPGGSVPKSFDKRDIKTIKFNSMHQRP